MSKPSKPTPLRIVRQGGRAYVGGGCARFGCGHPIPSHKAGALVDRSGGPCGADGCECPNVYRGA